MLARHTGLRHAQPAANHPQTATVKRVGSYAVTLPPSGGALTTVGGKLQYFRGLEEAQEFLDLYQKGNCDRAIPFACPGFSLVIYGSLVCRADQWVKDEAHERQIGKFEYVWYFSFNHPYGTNFVVAQSYDEAMIELSYLISRESTEDLINSLPF